MLSRAEFGRVLLQLTRISRALFQKIKILRKFPYFPYFRSVDAHFYTGQFTAQFACLCTHTKYSWAESHLLIEFFIFILSCQISHILRSIQCCAKVFINGSEVSAIFSWNQGKLKPRDFPLLPLSVSDWLIRKHHPIREEQTAWQLQAGTPKVMYASLKLRMLDFSIFFEV